MKREAVAVIGMSCLFPGAPDVDTFWRNILNKVDSVTEPPKEAWDPEVYYDPAFGDTDKVYCQRGGYLGKLVSFDPLSYGVPPLSVGGEPDQWLALELAHAAMADAGCTDLPEEIRHRTAVVLGKGTYLNGGNAIAIQRSLIVGQTLEVLKQMRPDLSDDDIEALREEMKRVLPPMGSEMVAGLIPNIIVGRIANRLDLMGPTYTVDAACASSLVALQLAVRDLLNGECDLALAGGSQVWMPVPALNVFCRLGALSPRQQIRPFDKEADGTLLGEGIGMVVLKRLSDAERDGDRIYSVIRGVGVASDGRGVSVMAPRIDGEELALRRAYAEASVSPSSIGLIEAHGTATPVGDVVEVQALTRVFGPRRGELPSCALGTVKSMISHTIPAAGIAGLIKTSLALYHKVLPPTLNVSEPNPKLELDTSPFYINTEARPWIHGAPEPRRAGINAFGFGGINAHAVLEEYRGPEPRGTTMFPVEIAGKQSETIEHLPEWDTEVFILESESPEGLRQRALELASRLGALSGGEASSAAARRPIRLADVAMTVNRAAGQAGDALRLAVVASSIADLKEKLERAAERLADPGCRQIRDVGGIYYSAEPFGRDGKLAFLFPGEGAQYQNMLADLCLHFPEVRETFDRIDRIFVGGDRDYLPSDYIFPRPAFSEEERRLAQERLMQMDSAIEAVLTANLAMFGVAQRLGLQPDAIVGHSTGEYSAAFAAGVLDLDTEQRLSSFSHALNRYYRDAASQGNVPRAVLLAIGADREAVQAIADETGGDIYVAIDNCPHQAVLIGDAQSAERARQIADREGLIYEQLTYDRAVHTPLFEPFTDPLRQIFEGIAVRPARTPLYSCTTSAPYPGEPEAIRKLMVDHWTEPVEFRRTVQTLYDEGFRIFVEVGPRGNLTAFVQDILRGRDFIAAPANVQRRSGMTQLNHMAGILASQGVSINLDYLYARRDLQLIDWEEIEQAADRPARDTRIQLATGWPMMRLSQEIVDQVAKSPAARISQGDYQPAPTGAAVSPSTPQWSGTSHSERDQGSVNGYEWTPDAAQDWTWDEPGVRQQSGTVYAQADAMVAADGPGEVSEVVDAYLETMEQFLTAQEEVLEAYLIGSQSQPAADPALVAWWDVTPIATVPAPVDQAREIDRPLSRPAEHAGTEHANGAADFEADHYQPNGADAAHASCPTIDQSVEAPAPDQDHSGSGAEDNAQRIYGQLLELVSDRTGYPPEMLDPELHLEADLGIDSIKRVEILGSYRQRYGGVEDADLELLAAQGTLREIVDVLARSHGGSGIAADRGHGDRVAHASPAERSFPLLGTIVALVPGVELTARRTFDLTNDLYLLDHTLGRDVSRTDAGLPALAVMPLTMSLEILCEAAACLVPDRTVIGMRDVRANRWIAWDQQTQVLQVKARCLGDEDGFTAVHVQLRNLTEDGQSGEAAKSPVIEATVQLGTAYPAAPQPRSAELSGARRSRWDPSRLYQDGGMFHGPSWQGVSAIDRTGAGGSVARLRVLPFDGFFRDSEAPDFVLDPIVLDAAGQVIGFWTAEHLEKANIIFPFRLGSLEVFAPRQGTGEPVACIATTRLIGDQLVDSDIDLVAPDGRLWMRLTGWADKRFDLPAHFHAGLVTSNGGTISTPWIEPVEDLLGRFEAQCRLVSCEFPSDQSFWKRVWAHRVLNRDERAQFSALTTPEIRQLEWLGARTAAKEALRELIRDQFGLELRPADIVIESNGQGRPTVSGSWTSAIDATPLVSLTHTRGTAAALVVLAPSPETLGIGVDIEFLGQPADGFADIAFTDDERALLSGLPVDLVDEWTLRSWCAKEAVAKAIGSGLTDGPRSVSVIEIDTSEDRIVTRLAGSLAREHARLAGTRIVARTRRQGELVCAVAVIE